MIMQEKLLSLLLIEIFELSFTLLTIHDKRCGAAWSSG